MSRVRGLAEWRPQAHTLALLDHVKAILTEYANFLPLTLRQSSIGSSPLSTCASSSRACG